MSEIIALLTTSKFNSPRQRRYSMHSENPVVPTSINLSYGNLQSYNYTSTGIAKQAGRDGACVFRSLVDSVGFKSASEKASRIILDQCPAGMLYDACQSFNSNVGQTAWAVCWKSEMAIQAIKERY